MQPAEPFILRPALALRVGVTGARTLEDSAIAPLRKKIAAVLMQIKAQVESVKYQIAAAREAFAFLTGLPVDARLSDTQDLPDSLSSIARLSAPS